MTPADIAERDAFRRDVLAGLSEVPKRLPGKYLWDEAGSILFDRICDSPDYYPTRREMALLPAIVPELAALVGAGATIVEYGSGASRKIRTLLDGLDRPRRYAAIDISRAYLETSVGTLARDYPGIAMIPVGADYAAPIRLPVDLGGGPVLGFFPGTSIGNLAPAEAEAFLARARDTLGAQYVVPVGTSPLDYPALFGRVAPVVLEIGFGMGAATAVIAADRRDVDFIGIEVHTPGVGALLKMVGEAALTNLRIVEHDAVEVVEQMIAPASLAGIVVWFPDPWHKARHNKRRLIQPAFVATLASRLVPGGFLHCATDWEDYASATACGTSCSGHRPDSATKAPRRPRQDTGLAARSCQPSRRQVSAKWPPCGSVAITTRLPPGTSSGPWTTCPPPATMRSAAASTSSTLK